jgi:hypothetical protein
MVCGIVLRATSLPSTDRTPVQRLPKVKVGSAVAAKANSPGPSPTAKNQSQTSSIGKGATSVKSSAPASFWTDEVDIDDDGTVEDNQFMDKATLSLVSLTISTYLSDPSDAVNVNVQFTRVPNGGPFHVATEIINGVSKQLTIEILNTNYQHM